MHLDVLLSRKSSSTLPLPAAKALLPHPLKLSRMDRNDQMLLNLTLIINLKHNHIANMRRQVKVKRLQGSPYAIEHEITGRGASATIAKAYNLDNLKEELVSKIVSISEEENSGVYKAELQILKELPPHPNLVNYKKIQISSERNLYLIMEFCNGGNLDKYLYDNKYSLSEDKIWFFLRQFCDGYKVLYEQALVHRDIKPENILLHNGDFKIADFGLSKLVKDPQLIQTLSVKGTPIYMAPEIPQQKEGNSKIDIFSLGVVLYRMAFKGEFPFFDQGRKYRNTSEYFKQLKVRKLLIPENTRSADLVDLVKRMLCKDPEERIGWKEMFEHPKIVKAVRTQRKKEITTMEEFKRSLIFVNKSVTKIEEFDAKVSEKEQKEENCLILEQAFNKTGKSSFERKLYRYKLMYTLIEYVNGKVKSYLKSTEAIHKHIAKTFNKLVLQGLEFSLYIVNSLRNISGEWDAFSKLEIINFENIFENDRLIIEEELEKIINSPENSLKSRLKVSVTKNGREFEGTTSRAIKLSYEDLLYTFLTEYWDYPAKLRAEIVSIVILLVDVYDLVLKFEHNQLQDEQNLFLHVEDEQSKAFYQYLMQVEKSSEQELRQSMQAKGLVFK